MVSLLIDTCPIQLLETIGAIPRQSAIDRSVNYQEWVTAPLDVFSESTLEDSDHPEGLGQPGDTPLGAIIPLMRTQLTPTISTSDNISTCFDEVKLAVKKV